LLWSFVYLLVRNLVALVWLLGRPRRSKELEILVLRHELAILRRQRARPRLTRADRALLAALSRSLPRTGWTAFPFKPETLLRWHRQLIAQKHKNLEFLRPISLLNSTINSSTRHTPT
jgi:putative transposase